MSQQTNDLRRLGFCLLLGVVAGTGVRYYIGARNRAYQALPTQPLLDWNEARRVALLVARSERAPLHNRAMRQEQYTRLVKQSEPLISDYLGVSLPHPITEVRVMDRAEWLEANFTSFEKLLKPVEEMYRKHKRHPGLSTILLGSTKERVVGAQMGLLLGFLGKRVLGQYDLSLLSPDPGARGALYYVEPNISRVQTQLGLNDEDFRLWIALHETTHAFEFEAYPWVREHFHQLLQRYLESIETRLDSFGDGVGTLVKQTMQGQKGQTKRHWFELLLSPEQRGVFEQIQALMSLVEGYSNHIMNAIGSQLLPSFQHIETRMAERQQSKTLIEQIFYRVTGMDLKLAQYQQGETFVNTVVKERGIRFASLVWECADNLPTLSEIRAPHDWIARMDASTR